MLTQSVNNLSNLAKTVRVLKTHYLTLFSNTSFNICKLPVLMSHQNFSLIAAALLCQPLQLTLENSRNPREKLLSWLESMKVGDILIRT